VRTTTPFVLAELGGPAHPMPQGADVVHLVCGTTRRDASWSASEALPGQRGCQPRLADASCTRRWLMHG